MNARNIIIFALVLTFSDAVANWVIVSPANNRPAATPEAPRPRLNSTNGAGKSPFEARAQAEGRMYCYKNPKIIKIFNYGSAQTGYNCTITFTCE
jgi:hypothetical protein